MLAPLLQIGLFLAPWPIRRALLSKLFGFQIARTARIGLSIVIPGKLIMGEGARIGSLTFIKGIALLDLGERASIGNLNWITGFPANTLSAHFADQPDRYPSLVIGEHSAITHRHLIDCTDRVELGTHVTFAGWGSQILTHAIDLDVCRQRAAPVYIGSYSFVGTRCVFLKGASVPKASIVAAGSIVVGPLEESYCIYGGAPARKVRNAPRDYKYFDRETGFVV